MFAFQNLYYRLNYWKKCLKAVIDVDTPEKLLATLIWLGHATINNDNVAILASEALLVDILTERMAEEGQSVGTLLNKKKQTVLHLAAQRQNILPRIIRVICRAAGANVHDFILLKDAANCLHLVLRTLFS